MTTKFDAKFRHLFLFITVAMRLICGIISLNVVKTSKSNLCKYCVHYLLHTTTSNT